MMVSVVRMKSVCSMVLAAAGLVVFGSTVFAEGIQVNPARDNTLYENGSGAFSNGSGSGLFAGRTNQGLLRRAVLAFDLGAIPPGSTINSVTLQMTVTRSIAGSVQTTLHRLSKDWGEGTSNAGGEEGAGTAASTGDATWIHNFFASSEWDNPGGDFITQASATASAGGVGSVTWASTPTLVSDVQGWVNNPSSNFGWLVRGDEGSNGTAKRFDSREAASPALLTIDFTPSAQELTERIYFPQFANGDGFFSQIVLVNPDSQNDAQVRITLRDDAGQPLELPLNGDVAAGGVLDAALPASATRFFETSGSGSLQLGSVVVESDRPVTGVIVFGGPFGLAGVLASDDLSRGFYGPVEVQTDANIDTGLALQNLENETVSVDLELVSADGVVVGTASVELPAFGKDARFVSQIFSTSGVDFSNFRGSIRSFSQDDLAAVLIQNRLVNGISQFATLPVVEFETPAALTSAATE